MREPGSTAELRCTFEDAERNHLRDGIAMSTHDKIAFFEEMILFAWQTGALAREDARLGVADSDEKNGSVGQSPAIGK